MAVSDGLRKQRVANGSRRKRDLAAVETVHGLEQTREGREAWAAEHLPGEDHYCVTTARLRLANSGKTVTADSVREWLRGRGWLKEQHS